MCSMPCADSLAVIDIGTQSALYLAACRHDDGTIAFGRQAMRSPRLGQGMLKNGIMASEAVDRCIAALLAFKKLADEDGMARIKAFGTRAFRWARNGVDAARQIEQNTGIPLTIISAQAEAFYGFRGALAQRELRDDASTAVIDIGGGSTEISWGRGKRLQGSVSLDIGAVGLTEKWRQNGRFAPDLTWPEAAEKPDRVYAVAGTATTLAAVMQSMTVYDARRVDGYGLSRRSLAEFMASYDKLTPDGQKALLAMAPERSDILPAGATLLARLMDLADADSVTVSDRGLRHGLAEAVLNNTLKNQPE